MRPADAAWVGLDRPHNRLVVTGVLRLAGDLDVDLLRERVLDRLVAAHPRLTHVARRGGRLGRLRWVPDPGFDVRHHVVDAAPGSACDESDLRRLAGRLLSSPLDPSRPPWQLHLVHRAGGGSALVGRFHHSLADGTALPPSCCAWPTRRTSSRLPPRRPPARRTGGGPTRRARSERWCPSCSG